MTSASSLISEQIYIMYQQLVDDVMTALTSNKESFIESSSFVSSALASALIALMCILPLFMVLKKDGTQNLVESKFFKVLMCIVIGERLGDVVFNMLPESWKDETSTPLTENPAMCSGTVALFVTVIVTILGIIAQFASRILHSRKKVSEIPEELSPESCEIETLEQKQKEKLELDQKHEDQLKKAYGYLLLVANCMYNFIQCIVVVSSYLILFRFGALATLAFLLNEIPHQVGGFVMLLRCSFSPKYAVLAQLLTLVVGFISALVAIDVLGVTSAMDAGTSFIVPFMAGGYVFIALITLLPYLETAEKKETFKQFLALIVGFGLVVVCNIFISDQDFKLF